MCTLYPVSTNGNILQNCYKLVQPECGCWYSQGIVSLYHKEPSYCPFVAISTPWPNPGSWLQPLAVPNMFSFSVILKLLSWVVIVCFILWDIFQTAHIILYSHQQCKSDPVSSLASILCCLFFILFLQLGFWIIYMWEF